MCVVCQMTGQIFADILITGTGTIFMSRHFSLRNQTRRKTLMMYGMELRNDVEAQKRLFRLSRLVSVEAARRNRKHFVFNKEVQKENVIKLNLFTSTTKRTEKIGV